jgi:hypothetical protein
MTGLIKSFTRTHKGLDMFDMLLFLALVAAAASPLHLR